MVGFVLYFYGYAAFINLMALVSNYTPCLQVLQTICNKPMIVQENLLGFKLRNFNFLRVVGQGSFAKVYEAFNEATFDTVAIKSISMAHFKNKKVKQLTEGEIKIMKACRDNNNIIKFIDNFTSDLSVLIVMEYCEDGTLDEYLKKMKRLTESKATAFLKQIIHGFKGLHEINVIHRDFKAANVLLHNGSVKIADLGMAKMLNSQQGIASTFLGTSVTMAPEVHEGVPYGLKADIWSLGVVFYQMIYGRYPYVGINDYEIYEATKHKPSFAGINISPIAKDFILKCLTFKPKERISWAEVYRHPLIKGDQKIPGMKPNPDLEKSVLFYDNIGEIEQVKPKMPMISQSIEFQKEKGEKLNVIKFQKMKLKNDKKKQLQAEIQRNKQLYSNRRNQDILVFKYIVPYLHILKKLPIHHANYMYLLSKKAYLDCKAFEALVRNKDDLFKMGSNFQEFVKSKFYAEIMEMVDTDVIVTKIQAEEYKGDIKNANNDLQREFDLEKVGHPKWDHFIQENVEEYEFLLMSELSNQKEQELKERLVVVIETLSYLRNHNKEDNFEAFDRSMEHMNYEDTEIGILNRLAYHLSQFK